MQQWDGITEFVAVTETHSFTEAAKQLDISTAQVSRQIRALERRLNIQLFYRTTRKVTTTEAGLLFYQHCRQLIDGLDDAERALTELQHTLRGKLKLTLPSTYGERKIAPLLNDFLRMYPDLEIECRMTNQKVDIVESGFDLAIRLGKLEDSATLVARQLASRKLFVCASPGYLHSHGEPVTPDDLSQHNCLRGTLEYWRFQEQGQERNIRISGGLRCNSGEALLDAALKDIGIVQLPDYYVEPYLQNGQLSAILSQYEATGEGVWAIYPPNRNLSAKVRLLVEYLQENLNSA